MASGFAVFSTALGFDRTYPWFEPVPLGWHIEIAGFALVLVTAGIVCSRCPLCGMFSA